MKMKRTARFGVGAGLLAGAAGVVKAVVSRRGSATAGDQSGNDRDRDRGRNARVGRARAQANAAWPAVPVKTGSAAHIDADRASSIEPDADGDES